MGNCPPGRLAVVHFTKPIPKSRLLNQGDDNDTLIEQHLTQLETVTKDKLEERAAEGGGTMTANGSCDQVTDKLKDPLEKPQQSTTTASNAWQLVVARQPVTVLQAQLDDSQPAPPISPRTTLSVSELDDPESINDNETIVDLKVTKSSEHDIDHPQRTPSDSATAQTKLRHRPSLPTIRSIRKLDKALKRIKSQSLQLNPIKVIAELREERSSKEDSIRLSRLSLDAATQWSRPPTRSIRQTGSQTDPISLSYRSEKIGRKTSCPMLTWSNRRVKQTASSSTKQREVNIERIDDNDALSNIDGPSSGRSSSSSNNVHLNFDVDEGSSRSSKWSTLKRNGDREASSSTASSIEIICEVQSMQDMGWDDYIEFQGESNLRCKDSCESESSCATLVRQRAQPINVSQGGDNRLISPFVADDTARRSKRRPPVGTKVTIKGIEESGQKSNETYNMKRESGSEKTIQGSIIQCKLNNGESTLRPQCQHNHKCCSCCAELARLMKRESERRLL